MPPKFSLQPVLDYRHNLVEALEIELGSLLNAKLEIIHGIHIIIDAAHQHQTECLESNTKSLSTAAIQWLSNDRCIKLGLLNISILNRLK